MTGVLLETACWPSSRERNQKPPRTARVSAAAASPVAILDFDFCGGGSFWFDLFLDFLLIETIPCESSFESDPYSASNHSRHSQSLNRRASDGVAFVEQVLRGDEDFEVTGKRARDHHVNHREAAERQTVLIIVELFARRAELNRGGAVSRVRINSLQRELIAGNLGDQEPFEPGVLRSAPDGGVGEKVTGRYSPVARDVEIGFGLDAARTRASQVAPLARDQRGSD